MRPIARTALIADRRVIEKYGPPSVIVDANLDVVQFRGRTGPFLDPSPGEATLNVLKLVRPELLVALREATRMAFTDWVTATSPAIALWGESGPRSVSLEVMPLNESAPKCVIVVFNEIGASPPPVAVSGGGELSRADQRVVELERELSATKEYLQSTIQELEAANEGLQSANEELQSSNEELQSTNEELETSKEELQSTNEELATVNDELHHGMAQLNLANDDLHNVLRHSASALVVVGPDLRIRRFSATAEKLLSLTPTDVGRPIAYLRNVMSARDIEQVASEVIASVAGHEKRVRCVDGSWYLMRMMPYVTADHMIRGLVIELTKAALAAPDGASIDGAGVHPLAIRVLSALPDPVMLVDGDLKLVWANRALFETYALSPAGLGKPLAEVCGAESLAKDLLEFIEEVFGGEPVRDMVLDRPFGRASDPTSRFSGRLIVTEGARPALALISLQKG